MNRNKIPHDPLTYEFIKVHPRRFLGLWNARNKVRTYVVPRLALSPNGLKRAST
jgi:hypothetical protein